MGEITKPIERSIIEKNISEFLKQSTYRYAFITSKTPIYVTYYSVDNIEGGADINLGGVNEIIGNESPIKFNKILNFPLYNFPQLENNFTYDEIQGLVSDEIAGDAIILPSIIEPKVYDFFAIDLYSSRYLFCVKDIASDRLEGDAFWKIGFYLTEYNEEDILKYNLANNYVVETEHVGTGEQVILRDDVYSLIREYQELDEQLIRIIIKTFFSKHTANIPMLRSSVSEFHIYEPSLIYLLKDKKLLESDLNLNAKSLSIEPVFYNKLSWLTTERFTVIGAAHSGWVRGRTSENYFLEYTMPTNMNDIFYPDYASRGLVKAIPCVQNLEGSKKLFPDIVDDVELRMDYKNIEVIPNLHDLTINFLANKLETIDDKKYVLRMVLDALNTDFPVVESYIYFYIPIMMECCRRLKNNLVQNKFIRV